MTTVVTTVGTPAPAAGPSTHITTVKMDGATVVTSLEHGYTPQEKQFRLNVASASFAVVIFVSQIIAIVYASLHIEHAAQLGEHDDAWYFIYALVTSPVMLLFQLLVVGILTNFFSLYTFTHSFSVYYGYVGMILAIAMIIDPIAMSRDYSRNTYYNGLMHEDLDTDWIVTQTMGYMASILGMIQSAMLYLSAYIG